MKSAPRYKTYYFDINSLKTNTKLPIPLFRTSKFDIIINFNHPTLMDPLFCTYVDNAISQ